MNVLAFSLIVCAASVLAGFLGALTGLGGGVVIVPVLCLLFKVDLHYAIGASLISVIATSSGAAAAFTFAKAFRIFALACSSKSPLLPALCWEPI